MPSFPQRSCSRPVSMHECPNPPSPPGRAALFPLGSCHGPAEVARAAPLSLLPWPSGPHSRERAREGKNSGIIGTLLRRENRAAWKADKSRAKPAEAPSQATTAETPQLVPRRRSGPTRTRIATRPRRPQLVPQAPEQECGNAPMREYGITRNAGILLILEAGERQTNATDWFHLFLIIAIRSREITSDPIPIR